MALQKGEPVDCAGCEARCPELLPENEDVWELWVLSCTQWRAGAFSVVGLDYNAVFRLAEMYEIELGPAEFARLRALEARELERLAAKAREEAGKRGH